MSQVLKPPVGEKVQRIADHLLQKLSPSTDDVRKGLLISEIKLEPQHLLNESDHWQTYNNRFSIETSRNDSHFMEVPLDAASSLASVKQEACIARSYDTLDTATYYEGPRINDESESYERQMIVTNCHFQKDSLNTYSDNNADHSIKISTGGAQLPIAKTEDVFSFDPSAKLSSEGWSHAHDNESTVQNQPSQQSAPVVESDYHKNSSVQFVYLYSCVNSAADGNNPQFNLPFIEGSGNFQPTTDGYYLSNPYESARVGQELVHPNASQPIPVAVPNKHTVGYLHKTVDGLEVAVYQSEEGQDFVFMRHFEGPGYISTWICRACQYLNQSLQLPLTVPTVWIKNFMFNADPAHPKAAHICTKPGVVFELAKNYAELRGEVLLPGAADTIYHHMQQLKQHIPLHDYTGHRPEMCGSVEISTANHSIPAKFSNSDLSASGTNPTSTSPSLQKKKHSYQCRYCPKRFLSWNELQVHIEQCALGRPFTCNVCSRRFKQAAALLHHKRIHTNERPYKCMSCGKRFIQKSHIDQHIRLHTGEKPFLCHVCGKTFRQKSGLDQHTPVHRLKEVKVGSCRR